MLDQTDLEVENVPGWRCGDCMNTKAKAPVSIVHPESDALQAALVTIRTDGAPGRKEAFALIRTKPLALRMKLAMQTVEGSNDVDQF